MKQELQREKPGPNGQFSGSKLKAPMLEPQQIGTLLMDRLGPLLMQPWAELRPKLGLFGPELNPIWTQVLGWEMDNFRPKLWGLEYPQEKDWEFIPHWEALDLESFNVKMKFIVIC